MLTIHSRVSFPLIVLIHVTFSSVNASI